MSVVKTIITPEVKMFEETNITPDIIILEQGNEPKSEAKQLQTNMEESVENMSPPQPSPEFNEDSTSDINEYRSLTPPSIIDLDECEWEDCESIIEDIESDSCPTNTFRPIRESISQEVSIASTINEFVDIPLSDDILDMTETPPERSFCGKLLLISKHIIWRMCHRDLEENNETYSFDNDGFQNSTEVPSTSRELKQKGDNVLPTKKYTKASALQKAYEERYRKLDVS